MTTDLGKVAEACRAFLAMYDDQSVERPEPSAFGPVMTRLLWALDGTPEDHERATFQLEPERAQRLFEVLRSAGAHPSGLGSYEAASDALALREDLMAQVEVRRG